MPMLFAPTIGAAIAARHWFLWVRCPAWGALVKGRYILAIVHAPRASRRRGRRVTSPRMHCLTHVLLARRMHRFWRPLKAPWHAICANCVHLLRQSSCLQAASQGTIFVVGPG
jgi:hypothetical protein